ncbi:unnamed protein product [Heligmosomoides polygyrus]|uniref:Transcriptional regulator n=1 Tax=Heligmosomoides polygyrus TaxID=6339 RepID=A0A183F219_HELPZ|nr:unnamed protein product [Heligmosomoides polygyrus]
MQIGLPLKRNASDPAILLVQFQRALMANPLRFLNRAYQYYATDGARKIRGLFSTPELINRRSARLGSLLADSVQKKIEELPWLSDSGILDGYLSTAERGDISPTRSLATEMMTELSCPDSLTPSYLTDSQLIVECTGSEMDLKPCPGITGFTEASDHIHEFIRN